MDQSNLKHNDGKIEQKKTLFYLVLFVFLEWTENEIQAFTEALDKFNDNWKQIAEYVHRSEQSCRAFYQKYRKKNGLIDDEHVKIYFNKKKEINYFSFH